MVHERNKTHLPPRKSAEEYEREIARLDNLIIWSVVNKLTQDSEFHGTRDDCLEWITDHGFKLGREMFVAKGMVP